MWLYFGEKMTDSQTYYTETGLVVTTRRLTVSMPIALSVSVRWVRHLCKQEENMASVSQMICWSTRHVSGCILCIAIRDNTKVNTKYSNETKTLY